MLRNHAVIHKSAYASMAGRLLSFKCVPSAELRARYAHVIEGCGPELVPSLRNIITWGYVTMS